MPIYECAICNISTSIKTHYNRHLKTNKHLKNEKLYREKNGKSIILTTNDHNLTTKHKKSITNELQCPYCEKIFSTKGHLNRHIKNYCKNIEDDKNENTYLKTLLEEQKKMFNEERVKLYEQIDLLLNKVGNTTITNNQTNNIQLNNWGAEDLGHITDSLKTELIKIPYGAIPKMIEAVHFNDKYPQNKNISIANKKDNMVKIYSGGKWVYKNRDETINDLVEGKYLILDNHYEKLDEDKVEDLTKKNYLKFRKEYDEGDEELVKTLKQECELILLNNR